MLQCWLVNRENTPLWDILGFIINQTSTSLWDEWFRARQRSRRTVVGISPFRGPRFNHSFGWASEVRRRRNEPSRPGASRGRVNKGSRGADRTP